MIHKATQESIPGWVGSQRVLYHHSTLGPQKENPLCWRRDHLMVGSVGGTKIRHLTQRVLVIWNERGKTFSVHRKSFTFFFFHLPKERDGCVKVSFPSISYTSLHWLIGYLLTHRHCPSFPPPQGKSVGVSVTVISVCLYIFR